MFIFGSSLLVLRCATALKSSSLEVTSSWMSLAGYPANNVAFPGRVDPADPGARSAGERDPGSRSHELRTVDPGSPAASPPPAGEGGRMGHYCQLRVMAMSPGIPSGQSTTWTRSL